MNKDPELLKLIEPIQDPELFISIVELGLIYGVEKKDDKNVEVEMTLTSPGCPVGPQLIAEVQKVLKSGVPGAENIDVKLIWTPPWDPKVHCSEDAKMQLGIF